MAKYYVELEKKYLPYVKTDDDGRIIGFVEGTPLSAKEAAKEHIQMSKKFDDVSNYEYWDNLLDDLGL